MLQRSLDLYDRKHSRFADVVNGHVFGRKPHVVSHPLDTTALPHCEANRAMQDDGANAQHLPRMLWGVSPSRNATGKRDQQNGCGVRNGCKHVIIHIDYTDGCPLMCTVALDGLVR